MEITEKKYCDLGEDIFELQFYVKNDKDILEEKDFHPFGEDKKLRRFIDLNLPPYTHTNVHWVAYLPETDQFVIRTITCLRRDEFDDEKTRFENSDFKQTDFNFHSDEENEEKETIPEITKFVKVEEDFVFASIMIPSNEKRIFSNYVGSSEFFAESFFNPHSPIQTKKAIGTYDVQKKAFIYTAKFPKRKLKNFIAAGFEMK